MLLLFGSLGCGYKNFNAGVKLEPPVFELSCTRFNGLNGVTKILMEEPDL